MPILNSSWSNVTFGYTGAALCPSIARGSMTPDELNRTIDFIMYKPAGTFESLSTRVIDEKYASDHLPVISEIKMK